LKKIAQAKAEAERANEDVRLRKLKVEAEQNRQRNIAAINAIASHIAHSFYSATQNPKQVFMFIWYVAILATGVYTAREIARFCRVVIESTLGKPKLIRETSRKSLPLQYCMDILDWIRNLSAEAKGVKETRLQLDDFFEDVALPQPLKERVLSLATAASKSRENDAPHRHILFYGLPGTGKTMVARKLAKSIGMEYAMMSGGDVGPLGTDAVTQIHSLFRWSKFCRNGVLLFIDEAEAFLANRSTNTMSENAHNALNALLYNTGTERKDFMMVLATNR
jgi:ATPase family AAA domain-containing protein 3A/B